MTETAHITAGVRIVGEIRGAGSLRIDGVVDGSVRLDGRVEVSLEGIVEGSIEAEEIRIDGRLVGYARAGRSLETGPEACVDGDLAAPEVSLHPLSAVTGEVEGERATPRAPRRVRRRGEGPGSVRRSVPEPKMPVMLRARGVRRTIA